MEMGYEMEEFFGKAYKIYPHGTIAQLVHDGRNSEAEIAAI